MYRSVIENNGDSKFYAKMGDSSIVFDAAGNGANPVDAMLAALCACMGHYVRDYLDGHHGKSGFSIEAEAGVMSDKTSLACIDVRIDLKSVKLNDREASDLLKVVQKSKIHRILNENPGVTVALR